MMSYVNDFDYLLSGDERDVVCMGANLDPEIVPDSLLLELVVVSPLVADLLWIYEVCGGQVDLVSVEVLVQDVVGAQAVVEHGAGVPGSQGNYGL